MTKDQKDHLMKVLEVKYCGRIYPQVRCNNCYIQEKCYDIFHNDSDVDEKKYDEKCNYIRMVLMLDIIE